MQEKYLQTTSRSSLESQDKLGKGESFEARTRGALSPYWTLVDLCKRDLEDPVIRAFIKDLAPKQDIQQAKLLELLKHSEEDRAELIKVVLRDFASFITNEYNCPDIEDDIIDEYINQM